MTEFSGEQPKIYTSSVRRTLLAAFGAVALGSLVLAVLVLIFHGTITSQYVRVTDRLILENRFVSLVPEYLDSYFEVISGGQGAESKLTKYQALRNEISGDITILDRDITDPESLIAYRGFKNFALSIVRECDAGVELVQQGKISEAWDTYAKNIAPMKPFVFENANHLLTHELRVIEDLEKRVVALDTLAKWIYLALFLLIYAAVMLVSLKAANRIIKPMGQLSQKAREISEGNLAAVVDAELLARRDEIGSLADSFNEMLKRLKVELESQKQVNQDLADASQGLASKNDELARTNRLMVNREMKMIKLKNQIMELENKLKGGSQ